MARTEAGLPSRVPSIKFVEGEHPREPRDAKNN
jgi:hypothetical protein